ncbi:MAG: OmpA family protein [Chromatiaceae bacterium]|nr:OmpA family protein [Chromatiaceae bacterium]
MTEPKIASPMRTWLWLLAILVLGLGALLIWHQQYSQAQIQAHKATIGDQSQALTAAQTAHAKLSDQITALTSDLETATQGQRDLQARMQAQQQAHEATLAKVRDEAKAVEADLQQRLQGAGDEIAALKADIENLHQAATEAAASHEAHAQQITEDLTEEIIKFRTLLVGSDPDKAAMAANWEKRILAAKSEMLQARQALDTEQKNLITVEHALSQARQLNDELKQSLAQAGQQTADAQAALEQERVALAKLRDEDEMLKQSLSEAGQKAEATQAAWDQEHEALAQLRDENEGLKQGLSDAGRKIEAAEAALHQEREALATLQSDHAGLKQNLSDASQKIEAAEAALHQEREALATLRGDHAGLKQNLSDASQKIEAAEAALEQEREALANLRGDHAGLQDKLEDTQSAHADARSQLEKVTQAAAAKEAALAKDLAARQAEIAALNKQLDQARQQAQADLQAAHARSTQTLEQRKSLSQRLGALGGRVTDQGTLLALGEDDIRFQAGKALLPKGEIPQLDRIAAVLVEFPELKVRVEGHTDSTGRDETNLVLSQQRAETVLGALVERGVAAERLTAAGLGKAKPIASNDTQAGRSQNRRVEIYVLEP